MTPEQAADGKDFAAVTAALRAFLASPAACAAAGALRPAQFSAQMLREDREGDAAASAADLGVATVFRGLHGGASYAAQLAGVLCEWHASRTDPLTRRAALERASRLAPVPPSVAAGGVISLDGAASDRVRQVPIALVDAFVAAARLQHADPAPCSASPSTRALVDALGGARGLLALLGHAQTAGSVPVAPLTRAQCERAFQRRRSAREPLSVGARALAKHCQRSAGAWGGPELRGNDARKNARALEALAALMDDAVWKNVHALPAAAGDGRVVTMELRDSRGYGARWEMRDGVGADPDGEGGAERDGDGDEEDFSFRGFLEPPMADGHERRWRH